MTNAKEHNRDQLEVLVDDKEVMYVFDRGYEDYKRFDSFTDDSLFFVCRLKKNAVIQIVDVIDLLEGSTVLADTMAHIGTAKKSDEECLSHRDGYR